MSVIKPNDIDTSKHFFGAFGNMETEISANYIVRFCQERGNWEPFSYDELNGFCQRVGHKGDFWFNRLGKDGFVEKVTDGLYHITHRFVCRCYEASPGGDKHDL